MADSRSCERRARRARGVLYCAAAWCSVRVCPQRSSQTVAYHGYPATRSGSEADREPAVIKPRPLRILVIGTLRGANEVAVRQQPVADVASKAANLF
jgi:hypothetical protein